MPGRNQHAGLLYRAGVRTYADVLAALDDQDMLHAGGASIKVKPEQQRLMRVELGVEPPIIDAPAISEWLSQLTYPLYFLDFETLQSPLPTYAGQHPFEQLPTQYSLHILHAPGGKLDHLEFLADENSSNPRRDVAQRLVQDIPQGACILAWNRAFERTCIKKMAEKFPDLREHLQSIYDGVLDLADVFKKKQFYIPGMHGKYSIKVVLPLLFPEDPNLDYHALDVVHNGSEAVAAFKELKTLPPPERQQRRNQLLKYCELDTLAMVKIHETLQSQTPQERKSL
jgi:hypothetical protein